MSNKIPLITAKNLCCIFGHGKKAFMAVKDNTFDIYEEEIILSLIHI